ncbi:D-alanyl-D-alanine carboxypeptidase precursor [Micromonospora sp. MW-13]|uniref:serine hydrolase domain-containing protein n=1 Tax=Micromonospora sp. MW-13 TaxID=2094022 RepID=UPI000E446AF4|nr:serine hydrolase domain-containing protein [Micromonospora sp. MW-13]RGC66929.1 D-alanyl-D-alanine carboxypeptidase precursor [Micromonospora sp. MW-13]
MTTNDRRRHWGGVLAGVVLLVAATGGPAAAHGPAAPGCAGLPATAAALRGLTGTHLLVGAAIEVYGPNCGRWSGSSGRADLRTGRPMRADERIRIGSSTKTFTATVVLQLVAEGRLALDAPVERYLPGVVRGNGYDGRRITVRDLLRHTSGLPDHVDALAWDRMDGWRYRHHSPDELITLATTLPAPGPGWHYSTTNYVLAGLVVERVTGRDIGTEITRRVLVPLGLRDTYWPGDAVRIRGPHPRGYAPAGPADVLGRRDVTRFNMSFGGAGGALVSTLADQNRFFAALLGGRLLDPARLAELTRTVPAEEGRLWPGARYGLGIISTPLTECGGTLYWGHGGTTPGFRTLGGVTTDGRRAQLVVNDEPVSYESWQALSTTLHTALCETR